MPVVVKDEVKIRLMMPLSLSYDHRLVDGGAAARFLNEVINYLEAPSPAPGAVKAGDAKSLQYTAGLVCYN